MFSVSLPDPQCFRALAESNRGAHATSRPNGGLVSAPVARQNPNPIDPLAQILTALFVSLSFSQMAIGSAPSWFTTTFVSHNLGFPPATLMKWVQWILVVNTCYENVKSSFINPKYVNWCYLFLYRVSELPISRYWSAMSENAFSELSMQVKISSIIQNREEALTLFDFTLNLLKNVSAKFPLLAQR